MHKMKEIEQIIQSLKSKNSYG